MGAEQSSPSNENFVPEVKRVTEIKFYLQDTEHVAKCETINPNTSLNHYLRNILNMKGTKGMCFEGGCGACVVVLQNKDPITQKDVYLAVNSCLVPLLSCNGWSIYTIEGIGNAIRGFHQIQQVLAHFNGTQCGFCSPGMVMNMYALYQSGKLTMEEVENSFSGNICRCTGYRPILSAFKSMSSDASEEVLGECPDVEDFVMCYKENCPKTCKKPILSKEMFFLQFSDSRWVKVHTLRDLLKTLSSSSRLSYRLVAGNTAQGVFSAYKQEVDLYIDVSEVAELTVHTVVGDSCVLGANVTLNNTIEFLTEVSSNSKFAYLKAVADHISLIANVPVRNRATLAGNLIIKKEHNEFPSDIFLILETVGAKLTIVDTLGHETVLSALDFVNYKTKPRIVLKTISLKALPNTTKYISYKIMPRAQNTHALVNAGFLFKFTNNNILRSATIVYGNINPAFVHATATEQLLSGKNLFDNSVLQQAYNSLKTELRPNVSPPDPSPAFRQQLAINLFYKAVLSIAPTELVSPRHQSGGHLLKRTVSKGVQDYETNKSMYPLTEAIPKLEALAQTSGEAEYVIDLPDLPHQLFGSLVLAEAPPNSTIVDIDASRALKAEDIVAFYKKDDIPGINSFTPSSFLTSTEEEIFCSGRVKYYQQPIGILVGNSQKAVDDAIRLISVKYDPPNVEPILTSRQAIKENRTDKITQFKLIKPPRTGNDVKHTIKGTFDIYHQYHFHMETQTCQVIPTENGLTIYPSTQWMDLMQVAVSRMLNISQSKVHVEVRRCGGAFGGKLTRANMIGCAASLAAWKLKRPVKIWLPLTTNMAAIGKRFPLTTDYEVGVDDKGVIQYMDCQHYNDVGYQMVENILSWFESAFMTVYTSDTFKVQINQVTTDTHVNTWTRGPGSTEGVGAIESIIEHIAYSLNLDPLEVRKSNLSDKTQAGKYIADMKKWANIDTRKSDIATFNKNNRWKKKGLAGVPMFFDIKLVGPIFATVSIFHNDGSVQICHGGIEIGQGVNTKAAQVCAYKFKIPLEKITVMPSTSFISPNDMAAGGSICSEGVCYGVAQACDQLLERIKPYRPDGTSWEDAIKKCHENVVNLKATGEYSQNSPGIANYYVYGMCAVEVLLDVLTGQHIVTRVDLIEDTGVSLSPMVDVGQAEGAFIMGLGYYTMEKIVFSYEGKVLTNRTWNYYVPGALDIPLTFNIKFPKDNPNPVGVLKTKGVGEPAMCSGITIALAIRNAVASARTDAAETNEKWYRIDGPTDVEDVLLHCLNDPAQYTL